MLQEVQKISAADLLKLDLKEGVILDVRTQDEHNAKSLACEHLHIPLNELTSDELLEKQGLSIDKTCYVVCHSGFRAAQAASQLMRFGYKKVFVVEGGIVSCEECGHFLATRQRADEVGYIRAPMSIERQVRIVAGFFVFVGSMLGLFYSSAFTVIPLFVGGGLVYAGITNWCGMALLLMRTPWNRRS